MAKARTLVGLDVHATRVVAAVLDVETGELAFFSMTADIARVAGFCAGLPGPVRAAYEAGPTGCGLARELARREVQCVVAAPSKIGDVAADAHNVTVLDHRPADCSHPDPLPVGPDQFEFDVVGLAVGNQTRKRCLDHRGAVGIVGSDRVRDLRWIGRPLETVDAVDLVRPGEVPGGEVVLPAAHLGDLLGALEQAGRVCEIFLGVFARGDVRVQRDDRDRPAVLPALKRLAAGHDDHRAVFVRVAQLALHRPSRASA